MNGFKSFLETSVGGAYGRQTQGFSYGNDSNSRVAVANSRVPNYQTAAYRQSIVRGKESERDISDGMETSCGFKLMATATQLQDMRQAIDTFMIKDGQKIPVQIKARKWGTKGPGGQVANDVGYEVAKDFNANDPTSPPDPERLLQRLNGRDMRGLARMTVVLAQEGDRIYIIDTDEGHKIIEKAVRDWTSVLSKFDATPKVKARYSDKYQGHGIEITRKFDTRDNYWKIMAYIRPDAFKSLQICGLKKAVNTRFDY